jgi:crotonobetainyl-CoA:carnitine CoA-transferase CaiB-like acyl-CoA transferase
MSSDAHPAPAGPRPVTPGPLDGVRVLDLTRVIMGPFATQVLADQGADVVMVEQVGGDTNRVMGPGPHAQLSGIALNLLRNKRSLTVDLKTAEGRELAHRLAATCDVLVTTMRPGALRRLGLDYASIRAVAPDIIYCQAQGFDLDSPQADEPAYDDVIQAATGVTDIMQRVYGRPLLLPTIFTDKVCGLVIAQAVTAALVRKLRTGHGEHVEVSMKSACSAFMLVEHGSGAISEPPVAMEDLPAAGYPRVLTPERRPHATKDGWVHLFPYLPKHYEALFRDTGATVDPRTYVDQRAALRNSDALYREVAAIAPQRTTEEWLTYCREAGIPSTRLATLQELVDELPVEVHPVCGGYRVLPPLARFASSPAAVRRPAPLVGADGEAVVAELEAIETRHRSVVS